VIYSLDSSMIACRYSSLILTVLTERSDSFTWTFFSFYLSEQCWWAIYNACFLLWIFLAHAVNALEALDDCGRWPAAIRLRWLRLNEVWVVIMARSPSVDTFTRHPRRRELLSATWPAQEYAPSTFCECMAAGYTPTQSGATARRAAIKRLRGQQGSSCWAWWQARRRGCGGEAAAATDERNPVTSDRDKFSRVSCRFWDHSGRSTEN